MVHGLIFFPPSYDTDKFLSINVELNDVVFITSSVENNSTNNLPYLSNSKHFTDKK